MLRIFSFTYVLNYHENEMAVKMSFVRTKIEFGEFLQNIVSLETHIKGFKGYWIRVYNSSTVVILCKIWSKLPDVSKLSGQILEFWVL